MEMQEAETGQRKVLKKKKLENAHLSIPTFPQNYSNEDNIDSTGIRINL